MSVGYLPFTPNEIEILCNQTLERAIWHYGIEINSGCLYQSEFLSTLRTKIGVDCGSKTRFKVRVKVNKLDIGHIWVLHPFEKIWISVSHINPEYASGMTLYQHEMVRRFAKESYNSSDDYKNLMLGKEKLKVLVASLAQSIKIRDRKRAKKMTGETSRKRRNTERENGKDLATNFEELASVTINRVRENKAKSNSIDDFEPGNKSKTSSEFMTIRAPTRTGELYER